ncbi:MAG: NAD(P)/FAD-dependent oxidoreductase [Clostridia bacterium]|nr:NAD(P)/FAD-dependent oxidoreductase [Clostridia bacterium]
MFDAAIIGTGPAGLSAALNLKLLGKSVLWFGSPAGSDKVQRSEKIANYPGFGLVSGAELNRRFREHAAAMALEAVDKMVTLIAKTDEGFTLLADNEMYEAKTVLLATGAMTAKGFEGEAEYLGRGVSYCATCDGFLYRGKTIAVFLGAARFEHEAEYLAELAEKVYLFAGYRGSAVRGDNIEVLDSPIVKVSGGLNANAVTLRDGREIAVDGLFCLRNAVAPASHLPGLALAEDGVHIAADREMRTNIDGCYAAGDCVGRPYQIAKAVGEGNIAAHAMAEELSGR